MCLVLRGNQALVADAKTFKSRSNTRKVVPGDFYRVLGGSINFNEATESAVRREIREELHSEIENLERIDVIENLFLYAGAQNHEIVFLFRGDLVNEELYEQETIHIIEDEYEFDARWISLNLLLNGDVPLYPVYDYKSLFQRLKNL